VRARASVSTAQLCLAGQGRRCFPFSRKGFMQRFADSAMNGKAFVYMPGVLHFS
jgi:hypothetical protein